MVEKLKFLSFDNEKGIPQEENIYEKNVTNKRYQKKIDDVKNEKIRKSLLNLTKLFEKK